MTRERSSQARKLRECIILLTGPFLWSPGSFSDFRDVIHDFTHSRLKKIEPLLKEIRLTGGCSEFYLSWFVDQNAGVVFACDLLAELARLHIDLALDLYPFVPSAKGEIDASA